MPAWYRNRTRSAGFRAVRSDRTVPAGLAIMSVTNPRRSTATPKTPSTHPPDAVARVRGARPRRAAAATLAALGYEEPTPIQLAAIPPLLSGTRPARRGADGHRQDRRVRAADPPAARRRSTSAAGRPVDARRPGDGARRRPSCSRRRASSRCRSPRRSTSTASELGVRVVPVYGGQPITTQLHRLARGVDVVVATPGRAVDHLDRGTLRFDEVDTVVLDEADEMLDMGFADDLEKILGVAPRDPPDGAVLGDDRGADRAARGAALRHPARVQVQAERGRGRGAARVRQVAYVVRRADKLAALGRILDLEDGAATLVFARTRGEVDDLAEALSGRGRDAAALHGGLSQEQRDRIMTRFRDGALDVLVATDVAARGLDIEHITPRRQLRRPVDPDTYVHRIGRTGRAGREGVAITLVEPREHRLLRDIERDDRQPLDIEGLPTVANVREHRLDLLSATLRESAGQGRRGPLPRGGRGAVRRVRHGRHRARRDQPRRRGGARRRGRGRARRRPPCPTRCAARRARPPGVRAPTASLAPDARRWRGRVASGAPARAYRKPGDQGRARVRRRPRPRTGPGVSGLRRSRAPARRSPARLPRERLEGRRRPARDAAAAFGSGGPGGVTRVFVGAGRAAGMRPGDLVGAITNEAGLRGNDIGAIQIADGFSLVEVPEAEADRVISVLRAATIRGQKVTVRRERY